MNTFKELRAVAVINSMEGENEEHKYWDCKTRLLHNSFLIHRCVLQTLRIKPLAYSYILSKLKDGYVYA